MVGVDKVLVDVLVPSNSKKERMVLVFRRPLLRRNLSAPVCVLLCVRDEGVVFVLRNELLHKSVLSPLSPSEVQG